ncbi:MAG: ADP-specific phosphofructokinase [Candidatus Syntrophoarchaeum caldarius]|uniref:ADP-specific phosphofructokinase n=1 Tax=Candidatus Syntropharchaeum caldarium TaxID=1838285 RepID=A0A1F2P873_9EURY|nr:MAG: ADP-specific phosphofructokinase [Candidatus Syntrophoarchaeum caldarius]
MSGLSDGGFILAFNSNIDAILRVSDELLESIRDTSIYPDLVQSMREGVGNEVSVDKETIKKLKEIFDTYHATRRIGGNAAIMAEVLSKLGVSPIILNRPAPSGGELVHFVFEFDLPSGGKERFIVNGGLEEEFVIDPAFVEDSIQEVDHMRGAIISGFHLLPDHGYSEKIDAVLDLIKRWKDKNPRLFIHCELGAFRSLIVAHELLTKIGGLLDSLGMNGEEFLALAESSGLEITPGVMIDRAGAVMDRYSLKRIVIHTEKFIVGLEQEGILAAFIRSLDFGAAVAAAYITKGEFPDLDEVLKVLHGIAPSQKAVVEGGGNLIAVTCGVYPVKSLKQAVGRGDVFTAGYVLGMVSNHPQNFVD